MLIAPARPRLENSFSRRASARLLKLTVGMLLVATLAGCNASKPRDHWWQFWRPKAADSSKVYNPDTVVLPPPPDVAEGGSAGSPLARGGAGGDAGSLAEPDALRRAPQGVVSQLRTVFFEYDSAELTPQAIAALDGNAQWLQQNAGLDIQIEGHTDERGTAEYNLNLGDRRAKAVKQYLMNKGVSGDKLHTISYGMERPLDNSHSESGFAKNRRVQFLMY